ncbi:MAG: hypothetical protein AB7P34_12085 [Vicinamibacterales bacterium]
MINRTVALRVAAALVFFAGGWLSWSEARLAARVADARQQIATLQFQIDDTLAPAASISDYLPAESGSLSDDIRRIRARVAYWIGGYDQVIGEPSEVVDPEVLLTTANAAFRASERETSAPQQEQVQRLDGVLQSYAAVLKAAPRHVEAAYNYEYVSRVRDQVASRVAGRKPAVPAPTRPAPARSTGSRQAGDLPGGNTIHGRPGGPPPEAKTEEFQVIAPMEYGDREAQPEATPGGKVQRKG